MTIIYKPEKILKKMASRKTAKSMLTKKLTVRKAAVAAIQETGVLDAKELERVALKVIKGYRKRVKKLRKLGATKEEAEREVVGDPLQLVQRIQNATVAEITTQIKDRYRGEYYTWIKTTAAEPDPKHRKKWGKIFRLGKGEMPGDRYGCQCGMKIHVEESRLVLEG